MPTRVLFNNFYYKTMSRKLSKIQSLGQINHILKDLHPFNIKVKFYSGTRQLFPSLNFGLKLYYWLMFTFFVCSISVVISCQLEIFFSSVLATKTPAVTETIPRSSSSLTTHDSKFTITYVTKDQTCCLDFHNDCHSFINRHRQAINLHCTVLWTG